MIYDLSRNMTCIGQRSRLIKVTKNIKITFWAITCKLNIIIETSGWLHVIYDMFCKIVNLGPINHKCGTEIHLSPQRSYGLRFDVRHIVCTYIWCFSNAELSVVVNFSLKILISQKLFDNFVSSLARNYIMKVPMRCKNVDLVESDHLQR